jgi:hypothetical protein
MHAFVPGKSKQVGLTVAIAILDFCNCSVDTCYAMLSRSIG